MEDEKIIELFICRDERAVTAVKEKYGGLLLGVSKRLLRSSSDAEECLNDTLLALWNTVPQNIPDSLRAYSLRLMRNISLNRLQYDLAEKRSRNLGIPLSELETALPDGDALSALDRVDFSILLDGFLRQLNQEARVIFTRRYFFFDSISDIARDLKVSESKVKSSLHRTRARFKRYLSGKGSAL